MLATTLIIKWFGQACFLVTTMAGTNVVIDPFGQGLGYDPPAIKADVVFVSHEHHDHNAVNVLKGTPKVVSPLAPNAPASYDTLVFGKDTLKCEAIPTFHDASGGNERGPNTVRVLETGGIRICHLGDLGNILSPAQVKAIGRVDVLMVPVGSVYTIDGEQAQKVVGQLKPRIVVPMHYRTPVLKIGLEQPDKFLKGFRRIKYVNKLSITRDSLPKETTVYVLKY
jgi:L-ascorbate metabolism protein UlaG (beta-lactamase superfamily)